MWDFISRSQYSHRHGGEGGDINIHFLLFCRPTPFTVAVNTFNISWSHLNGRQNNSCPILELLFCSQAEFFFSRSVNQSSTPAVCRVVCAACLGFDDQFIFIFQANYVFALCIHSSKRKSKFFPLRTQWKDVGVYKLKSTYTEPLAMNGAKSFSNMTGNFDHGQGPIYSFNKKVRGHQNRTGYPGKERHSLHLLEFEPRHVQLLA